MTALSIRTAPARWLFWPMALVAIVLVAAGTGIVPVAPFVALVALAVLLAAPMQATAFAVFAFALLVDDPGQRPMQFLWDSPLKAPGKLLYLNLHEHTHIQALRFSALELLIVLMMLIVVSRKLLRDPIDDPLNLGAIPSPMKVAFGCFFGAIVFLEIYGVGRGGDFRNSLWQLRQLFWLPVLGVLFGNAFKTARARVLLLRALMVIAWIRCAMGTYFYVAVAKPMGIKPDYTTTHSDTVLTVVASLIGLTALAEKPSRQHIFLNVLLQPMLLVGLIVNNRRLAFVVLGAGLAALVALGPPSLLRFLKRAVIVMLPVLAIYVAVGWNSTSGIFKPVSMIRSVSSQEDSSSKTRDIENFNLIQTLKLHPILGSGFGHEYYEMVQADRVDQYFAQYRYIAHNSVLWLLSLSGWVGFTFVWMVFPVAALVALRVYRSSTTVTDRVTAFAALAAVLAFVLQAWGDMGLQSWMATLIVSSLTGATGSMLMVQRRAEMTT
jgi:hypothetical protein